MPLTCWHLLTQLRIPSALLVVRARCWHLFNLVSTRTPGSFTAKLLSSQLTPKTYQWLCHLDEWQNDANKIYKWKKSILTNSSFQFLFFKCKLLLPGAGRQFSSRNSNISHDLNAELKEHWVDHSRMCKKTAGKQNVTRTHLILFHKVTVLIFILASD